jgi:hypothetical protein
MATMEPTPQGIDPPPPLRYGTLPRRRSIIDLSLAVTCTSAAAALTIVTIYIVPMAEGIYRDLGDHLPGITRALFSFSRFCRGGGIVLVWVLFALPPFLAPWAGASPPSEPSRFHYKRSRLLTTIMMTLIFGWVILALFMPYVKLIDTAATGLR